MTATGEVGSEIAAARAVLAQVPIGGRGPKTGYDREVVFGRAWADIDGNGCDTRNDILGRDLVGVTRRGACTVVSGVLNDPYTARQLTFAAPDGGLIQIDHVVPLSLAWQLGAAQWTQEERMRFANDPANLLAVEGRANQQKSDSGPDSWLPPNKAYRCTYVIRFVGVVSGYRLRLTPSMRDAITSQLDSCPSVQGSPTTLDLPSQVATVPPASVSASTPAADDADVYYTSCAAVRAAGKAPLLRGEPGYRAGLDRDADGSACE